jgi:hypothetical protein
MEILTCSQSRPQNFPNTNASSLFDLRLELFHIMVS